nr:MAG TPA: hypothetical protein [Caudoviricetes sp.]
MKSPWCNVHTFSTSKSHRLFHKKRDQVCASNLKGPVASQFSSPGPVRGQPMQFPRKRNRDDASPKNPIYWNHLAE